MAFPRLSTCLPDDKRHNFYDGFHKALRLGHCRMLASLGSHDFSDMQRSRGLLAELRQFITLGRLHLAVEDSAIHAALEARRRGAGAAARQEHAGHNEALSELESLIRSVEVATTARRSIAGHALYRCYALFAAADMSQMNDEETKLLGLLHQLFSDEELTAMEARMLQDIPADALISFISLMMPAQSLAERVEFLKGLRHLLGKAEFANIVHKGVVPALDDVQARDTLAALGLPQAA